MMIPRRKNEFDLLGEMFREPFFTDYESKVMKTDIKEKKDIQIEDNKKVLDCKIRDFLCMIQFIY